VSGETVESIEKELRRMLEDIRKSIEEKDPEDVFNDAVDFLVVHTPQHDTVGFDVLITQGGPVIRWTYIRGVCELTGSWGDVEARLHVPIEKCEEALMMLEDNAY